MGGVPSGRGCDGCRKQKKKCDERRPSCARCSRLGIQCVGSGERRFKFMEPVQFVDSRRPQKRAPARSGGGNSHGAVTFVAQNPTNDVSSLALAFLETIKPSSGWRFNLVSTYGEFLNHLPSRLGHNRALDASVGALVEAHASICAGTRTSQTALRRYQAALTTLRMSLSHPSEAYVLETLCATGLLGICQTFLGGAGQPGPNHSTGATQLTKLRGGIHVCTDSFEVSLLEAQCGPGLFEALWCEAIDLSELDWQNLALEHIDMDGCPRGSFMRCAAKFPIYLRRLWTWTKCEVEDAMETYETVQSNCHDCATRVSISINDNDLKAGNVSDIEFELIRIYAFHMTLKMMLGCILLAVTPYNRQLHEEMQTCAAETAMFTQSYAVCRPLAASIIPMALALAWIVTSDTEIRAVLETKSQEMVKSRQLLDGQYAFTSDLHTFVKRCQVLKMYNK